MKDLKIVPTGSAVQVRSADGHMLTAQPTEAEAIAWAAGYKAGDDNVRREIYTRLEPALDVLGAGRG